MPFIRIQLLEGRTKEAKEKIAKEIIDLIDRNKFAKRENVHVIYEDMRPEDYHHGGE